MKELSLRKRVNKIKDTVDIENLLVEKEDAENIRKYYRLNKIAYRIFHNREGYLHMGISRDSRYKKSDLEEPLREIESKMREVSATRVLELASGHGANTSFLAKRNPTIEFSALDLSTYPKSSFKELENTSFDLGDYHDLSQYPDNSFGLVFVIEALCHSNNKRQVLEEVFRILKKGGLFIIFDGYSTKEDSELTSMVQDASILAAKGMAVDKFESVVSFEKTIDTTQFQIEEKEDLSRDVLPTMERFERLAGKFFKHEGLTRVFAKLLPEKFLGNAISGYLMAQLIRDNVAVYDKHILKK